jgi:hypothetical protein
MLKATRGICCYVDHARAYAATRPRRPVAAFTGLAFPEHVTRALEVRAGQAGYTSPYWLSKAALRQNRVPLKDNQTSVAVCMDPIAATPIEVFHAEMLQAAQASAFLQEYPVPDPTGPAPFQPPPTKDHMGGPYYPWVYRSMKWRRVAHQGAVAAMRQFRTQHGLKSDIWLTVESVQMASLLPLPDAHSIPINEQPFTLFYNAEQSTYAPERFAPPYCPEATAAGGKATAAAASVDDGFDVSTVPSVLESSRIAQRLGRIQAYAGRSPASQPTGKRETHDN